MPVFNEVAIIAINFIALTLIITVFNHDKLKEKRSVIFVLMGISMLVWVDGAYSARILGNIYNLSLFFIKIAWFATPFVFFFSYMTAISLTGREDKNHIITKILFILAIFAGLVTLFTNFTISGEKFTNGIVDIRYGSGFYPYLGIALLMMFFTFTSLVRTKLNSGEKVFLLGLIIFFIANMIFNIALPVFLHVTYLYFLGDYSTIILLGFAMYAIFRHKLFDIRIFATEVFTLIIWTILFTKIFFAQDLTDFSTDSFVFGLTIVFGILLIRSIHELRRTEESELAKANELLRLKDEFVFVATHDLKTPVTAIDGYISLIEREKPKFSKEIKSNFEEVKSASDRLKQLVNDLLQVARGESGTIKVNVAKVDVSKIVKEIIEEVEPVANEKKVKITAKFDEGSQYAIVDEEKFPEVIENLLSNAIKFNKPGGSVKVEAKKVGSEIQIKVGDTGYGIPKEEQAKVFEKFFKYRGEKTADVPGTGLGLFVVRMLVEKMGGKIAFTSDENRGTTFSLTFESG